MEVNVTKRLCMVHMFNYSGSKCPFCEQDRIQHICKKHEKNTQKENKTNEVVEDNKTVEPKPKKVKKVNKVKKQNREVTASDLERLKAKFNQR